MDRHSDSKCRALHYVAWAKKTFNMLKDEEKPGRRKCYKKVLISNYLFFCFKVINDYVDTYR